MERDARTDALREALCGNAALERDFAELRMARLTGAELLFVNGIPVHGDPERRGDRGFPVELRAGRNELFALGVRGELELELWMPAQELTIGGWAIRHVPFGPDPNAWSLLGGHTPIFNTSTCYPFPPREMSSSSRRERQRSSSGSTSSGREVSPGGRGR